MNQYASEFSRTTTNSSREDAPVFEYRAQVDAAAAEFRARAPPYVALRHPLQHRGDDEYCGHAGKHERQPPSQCWCEIAACRCRQQHSERRARLHVCRVSRASIGRHALCHQALSGGPSAAHAEPGDRSKQDQLRETVAESAQRSADAIDCDGRRDHRSSPVAVAEEAEDDSAERRHQQRRPQRERRLLGRQMEFARDGDQQERVEDEIVKVENPRGERERDDPQVDRAGLALVHQQLARRLYFGDWLHTIGCGWLVIPVATVKETRPAVRNPLRVSED